MNNKNYHLKEIWQQKYKDTTCQNYEWIDSSASVFQKIKEYFPQQKDARILELGCGSSTLCDIINEGGYENITAIDFSKQIIKSRKNKNKKINFKVADFTQQFKLFEDVQYDVIIDKGSIDCIFCDESYLPKALNCILQCYKRLKDGGKLISISSGMIKNRKYWFRNKLTPFTLEIKRLQNDIRKQIRENTKNYNKDKIANNEQYLLFICTKSQNGQSQQENNMDGLSWDQQNTQQNENDKNDDKKSENQQPSQQRVQQESNEKDDQQNQENQGNQQNEQNEQNYENDYQN